MKDLQVADVVGRVISEIESARENFQPQIKSNEIGTIKSISIGIAIVSGLPEAGLEELILFPNGISGIVFYLDKDEMGVVLLGDYQLLKVGDRVERSGRVLDIGVGEGLLGRVINPLGESLDDLERIQLEDRWPIERQAPRIMDRSPVTESMQTGIKVIDAMIPIGKGQRELIIGDRQTGKTAIALNAILNQKDSGVLCVYCGIGQRASSIARIISVLKENDALKYTVVMVAEGNDPPGHAYIAPYAATSIAEYFMSKGRDVLIVYDDLTHHARAYREISLLLRRPPGREAYPGDIFYIHSRLLERATHLLPELGGGSLTALPIVETEAQNISAYIPTNLISITDGQIYLSPRLFELGVLPAVDIELSVSRVGGKVQIPTYRSIAGDLKLAYVQFEELESFVRFGTRLDEHTSKVIEHGRRIRASLIQAELDTFSVVEQIMILLALTEGLLDQIPLEAVSEAEDSLRKAAKELPKGLVEQLLSGDKFSAENKAEMISIAKGALKEDV